MATKKKHRTRFSRTTGKIIHKTTPILRSGRLGKTKRKRGRSQHSTRYNPLKGEFTKNRGAFKFRRIGEVFGGKYTPKLTGKRAFRWLIGVNRKKGKREWGVEKKAPIGRLEKKSTSKPFSAKNIRDSTSIRADIRYIRPTTKQPTPQKIKTIEVGKTRSFQKLDYYRNLEANLKHQTILFQKLRGVYLGPYPAPLGYEKICHIRLTTWGKSIFRRLRFRFMIFLISKWLVDIKAYLVREGVKYIGSHIKTDSGKVPKLTGALRRSLISSLKKSIVCDASNDNPDKCVLMMRLGSSLYYAGIANRMPNSWLRHSIDPMATQYFFSRTTAHLKKKAKKMISDMLKALSSAMVGKIIVPKQPIHRYVKRMGRRMKVKEKAWKKHYGNYLKRSKAAKRRGKGSIVWKPTWKISDLRELTLEEKESNEYEIKMALRNATRKNIVTGMDANVMRNFFRIEDIDGYRWKDKTTYRRRIL